MSPLNPASGSISIDRTYRFSFRLSPEYGISAGSSTRREWVQLKHLHFASFRAKNSKGAAEVQVEAPLRLSRERVPGNFRRPLVAAHHPRPDGSRPPDI